MTYVAQPFRAASTPAGLKPCATDEELGSAFAHSSTAMWALRPTRRQAALVAWLAWAVLVLAAYYVQLWRALAGHSIAPTAWTLAHPDDRFTFPLFLLGTAVMAGIGALVVAMIVWRARGSHVALPTVTVRRRLAGCAILMGGLAMALPLWRDRVIASAGRIGTSICPRSAMRRHAPSSASWG